MKVSTGYEPTPSDTILTQMNNLAHFAADVLGDKFQKLDVLPFRTSPSSPFPHPHHCSLTSNFPPTTVCSLPTWAPVAGPLLKLGAKWKTQLHATADATVQLAQAGKAAGNDSVMFNLGAAAGEKTMDDRTKMVAVTMNAGGMLAVRLSSLCSPLLLLSECSER